MKRCFAAAVAVMLLLSGCGVIRDHNEAGAYVSTSVLDMGDHESTGRVIKSAVYFLNNTSGTLTAEPRTLVVETGTNPAEVAVNELLKGPSAEGGLTGVAPAGMTLDYIEFSREVANVYLRYDGQPMQPKSQYILELALANTITDLLGATYICVFFNGVQTGFSGVPCAPLKKQTGSVEEAWVQASAKYSPGLAVTASTSAAKQNAQPKTAELQTILYYVSANGGYLLPEVHTVKYTDGECIEALILELKKNPKNTLLMKSPISKDVAFNSATLKEAGSGFTLALDLSSMPAQNADSSTDEVVLSYAAIIYTITGFIPNIQRVDISVAGNPVTSIEGVGGLSDGMQRSDYIGCIGSSAPLYFADQNSDLLLEVSRSMEQQKTWSARTRVLELLKGPLKGDGSNVWPVMPAGVTEEDIKSADVYADTAYVNLSQHFKDACSGLSSKNEMLLVYAMVNTITAMDGVSKVQFLVEGQQVQTLAGTLCLADPFLKNYRIVKQVGQ